MERKYRELFTVLGGLVRIDDRLAGLLEKPRRQPHEVDKGPKFSATITISNADITTVQSFLWSLSHQMNQRDFGFRVVDNRAAKGTIQVNRTDALLGMIRATFTVFEKDPDERTEDIVRYGLLWVPKHLMDVDEDDLSPQEIQEIGQGLIGLFSTADLLEKHWNPNKEGPPSWERDDVVTLRKWLTEVIDKDKLNRLERRWIKEIQDSEYPDFHLLKSIAVMVARNWLQDEKWRVVVCWRWLRFALSMVRVCHRPYYNKICSSFFLANPSKE